MFKFWIEIWHWWRETWGITYDFPQQLNKKKGQVKLRKAPPAWWSDINHHLNSVDLTDVKMIKLKLSHQIHMVIILLRISFITNDHHLPKNVQTKTFRLVQTKRSTAVSIHLNNQQSYCSQLPQSTARELGTRFISFSNKKHSRKKNIEKKNETKSCWSCTSHKYSDAHCSL